MKVSELTGALLDYWVGRADDLTLDNNQWRADNGYRVYWEDQWNPSANWQQAGVLIEKYQIVKVEKDEFNNWSALSTFGMGLVCFECIGITPLEAICRTVVMSKFGNEVEDIKHVG